MMQLSIEVPIFFPIIGILIILIFGFFLYKINENLNQIKKLNFIKTDDIKNQKEYVKKEEQEIIALNSISALITEFKTRGWRMLQIAPEISNTQTAFTQLNSLGFRKLS